jgi:hypothetical protein
VRLLASFVIVATASQLLWDDANRTSAAAGAPLGQPPRSVERFLSRADTPLTSFVAFRHLTASARSGQTTGWLTACTALDAGGFHYRIVGEGGSGLIRKRVLRAALEAEARARSTGDAARAALDPLNYEFLTSPSAADDEPGLARIVLKPRRKDPMLVDGWMFLTVDGSDLVRVEGRLAKAPSFWTRRVNVVRRYARLGAIRVPVSMESNAQVLIVGSGSFAMSYSYAHVNGQPVAEPAPAAEASACTVEASS